MSIMERWWTTFELCSVADHVYISFANCKTLSIELSGENGRGHEHQYMLTYCIGPVYFMVVLGRNSTEYF